MKAATAAAALARTALGAMASQAAHAWELPAMLLPATSLFPPVLLLRFPLQLTLAMQHRLLAAPMLQLSTARPLARQWRVLSSLHPHCRQSHLL